MKRIFTLLLGMTMAVLPLWAEHIDVTWPVSDKENLGACTLTDGGDAFITSAFALGNKLAVTGVKEAPDVASGFTAEPYNPALLLLTPSTRVTSKTAGHQLTFTITPKEGHSFKPTSIELDAAKCGTDGGNFDVYIKVGNGAETPVQTSIAPLRNKIDASNSTGYSHHTFALADQLVKAGEAFQLILYVYNFNGQDVENPKSIAFRGVKVGGEADEPIYDASHYFTAASCSAGDLLTVLGSLKNGESAAWSEKVIGDPTDFTVTAAEGYTAKIEYANKYATLTAQKDGRDVFSVSLRFTVSYSHNKGDARPLNRGLMAVCTSQGVLVSWRYRATDDAGTRFRLYRGTRLIGPNPITDRTTYLDATGSASSTYTLEVLNAAGEVVERQADVAPWANQTKYITLQGGAPTDPTSAHATYTPNDASYCDMDGDGEYEIILKWAPSNEKDAAGSGTTSPAFYACYKMDGTRMWMLTTGPNMFNSAHTTHFIAWDLDGDGFGEFMVKTAPGTIDGEGNYVIMPGDDPMGDYKGGKGKQTSGGEYLTVFDGMTGAELKTIKYHTSFADETSSFWGDSKENRSERYLAAIAWLDGEDSNPSAIFARGYYNGCKIGAYDWDGENLTMRWLHRGESPTKGTVTYADGTVKNLNSTVYGEGAHWISIGDVTGDGKQEIHYGSGALKPDGTTLYRTGLGHGDAIHLGDFIPSRPGLEYFMAHEEKSSNGNYGVDLRDAATGEIIVRRTAGADTGRGLIAHFNPEAPDAYFMDSADSFKDSNNRSHWYLYDTTGKQICDVNFGSSGASVNNRIYWTETLADDYYDKSYLARFNPNTLSFDRLQVNGSNYTFGNLNNFSKNNPCVLGDLLGDWREEIVNWSQTEGGDFQLVINATNYNTDYCLPHLMDDYAYRAQIINQNCCYNQPPHLSYNPIAKKTLERTIPASGWDALYTSYPVVIPEGITAYTISGLNAAADTLRMLRLNTGAVIPTGGAILFRGTVGQKYRFVPSTKATTTVMTTYLKGCAADSVLTSKPESLEFFYELRTDEKGVGFFKVADGTRQPAGTAWMRVKGTATNVPLDQYYIGYVSPKALGITDLETQPASRQFYDLSGRRVAPEAMRKGGVYITGEGMKVVR